MTQRVVIADAGPLIALARIEALYLLRQLFGRVCITRTVRDEVLPAKAAFADADLLVRMLAARLEAKHLGLALIGSAAVIGLAKTEGLIPAARPLLDQMVAAGYFIGPSVVSAVLCELGE